MKEAVLDAELRSTEKKSEIKNLRAKGMIPAVFYGKKEKPVNLYVPLKKFNEIIQTGGSNVLVTLKLKDDPKTAIVKEVQRDMISQIPIHIDFQAVSLKEKIQVSVPIHILGIAHGVKLSGGILQFILRELTVKCLPTQIPQKIDVDVSKLEIGHVIMVKDLAKPEDMEIVNEPGSIIVNIVAPTVIEEKAPEAAAGAAPAAAEPEVISKGKKEKEEGAAAQPAEGKGAPAAGGAAPAKK